MGDFVGLLEVLEKYLPPSGSPGVFEKSLENILKLGGLCSACRSSKRYLPHSGSPGVFEKS